jgi:hypothetical protein
VEMQKYFQQIQKKESLEHRLWFLFKKELTLILNGLNYLRNWKSLKESGRISWR